MRNMLKPVEWFTILLKIKHAGRTKYPKVRTMARDEIEAKERAEVKILKRYPDAEIIKMYH